MHVKEQKTTKKNIETRCHHTVYLNCCFLSNGEMSSHVSNNTAKYKIQADDERRSKSSQRQAGEQCETRGGTKAAQLKTRSSMSQAKLEKTITQEETGRKESRFRFASRTRNEEKKSQV